MENFFSIESTKEEAYKTPLSSEQKNQDVKSKIEQMLLFELLLLVSLESLKSKVVQLRKLELTLMDQVIKLNLDEGEFHKDVIASLQKWISIIQVTLKLLKQMLACEIKFKTLEPEYSDIRSWVGLSDVSGNLRIPGRRITKLEEKEATSSTELKSNYHIMKREQFVLNCSFSSGSDSKKWARIPRGVANPSVGLFESFMGLEDWLKKLNNLSKLKTPMKNIAKVLEF